MLPWRIERTDVPPSSVSPLQTLLCCLPVAIAIQQKRPGMSFMLSFFFIRLITDIRGLHGLAGTLPESLSLGVDIAH